MSETITDLLAELKSGMSAIYGQRLRRMYLYGSYARGQQRPDSDVDLLIVLDRLGSYGAEIERTSYLVADLSLKYGPSISRVFVSEADWTSLDSPFLHNVREEVVAA
jgi:predicted nucleotidyltransferase